MSDKTKVRFHSIPEMIDALATVRDTARLRAHLLSLDARERWSELETRLNALQDNLERGGETVTANASKSVGSLTDAVQGFLAEHPHPLELSTPIGPLAHAVHSCLPEAGLDEAARLMWEHDCGAIPVIDGQGHLVGIVTDRDACIAAYTRGQQLSNIRVEETMSRDVASLSPKAPLHALLTQMRSQKVRRIPVVDGGKLVGIVTLADVARYVESRGFWGTAAGVDLMHTLAVISEPAVPRNAEQTVAAQ